MEQVERQYTNGEIIVYWKPSSCIHSTICYTRLLEVFNPRKRPWVNMQGAPTKKIIEVVNRCPTDALTWKWNDESKNAEVGPSETNHIKNRWGAEAKAREGGKPQKIDSEEIKVKIRIIKNGPVLIEGPYTLVTDTGLEISHTKTTALCRCGSSQNMPYCDGSHRKKNPTGQE
ncbi:MAG TPA: hypothetical protein ENN63_01760 [Bacteroidetes bacterium]|nr:hypothetical protein [Bacteroidota bacterium]